jgi:hypothetical protein
MNTYGLNLLLEALAATYTLEDLEAGTSIESLLMARLHLRPSQAKALVEGATLLKEVRTLHVEPCEDEIH